MQQHCPSYTLFFHALYGEISIKWTKTSLIKLVYSLTISLYKLKKELKVYKEKLISLDSFLYLIQRDNVQFIDCNKDLDMRNPLLLTAVWCDIVHHTVIECNIKQRLSVWKGGNSNNINDHIKKAD